ncbi:MAG: Peptidyl-prolyl cis-trans isomerase cyp8 [Sclerophora amabilis]|nr:MAG: Peptidyl-prolyl cis-trans isomerase cyp8 [Sclerophora amabilis]
MGKGTDKLYITHSEWASEDAYSASAGSGVNKSKANGASFKRLPFNFCAVSLQPFTYPVCTTEGAIFDLTNILPWLKKHGTNPVNGAPLKSSELIKLHFAKNEEDEYVDPVTYKVFTDNSHIVALGNTGNVFAYDTVERLNIKAKMWRDLVSDAEFTRKDIITLQDPQNIASRDLSSFKYLQEGVSTLTPEQERERSQHVNAKAMGSSAKVLKAKEAVERARRERQDPNRNPALSQISSLAQRGSGSGPKSSSGSHTGRTVPYNAAQHTTGKAAASFTSTGLTPHTSGERALLTDEEYMLKPRRVKNKGYARIQTNLGDLNVELQTEYAPKAVWNFVQLAKKGYYRDVAFHRNIRNFMLQGGDPTGTGKGGTSIWGKNFNDEVDGPLTHDTRGVLSMANKGKNTNSSQFFITYRPTKHLDRKHTIFGHVVGGSETLSRLENSPSDSSDKPTEEITMLDVVVFVDPFEEFQKQKQEKDDLEKEKAEVQRKGGTEDEKLTWTGKRVRAEGLTTDTANDGGGGTASGVGKYLRADSSGGGGGGGGGGSRTTTGEEDEIVGDWDEDASSSRAPVKKKAKTGFGNFDNW